MTPSKTNWISLLILVAIAAACARGLFLFISDPEGPNLLIVGGTALVLFIVSFASYLFMKTSSEAKRVLIAIIIQLILGVGLYAFLH